MLTKSPLLITLLTLTLMMAGCHETPAPDGVPGHDEDGHAHDDGHDHSDGTSMPAGDVEEPTYTLEALAPTGHTLVGQGITIEIEATAADGNTATTDHAGIHFGTTSTRDMDASKLTPADFTGASPHTSTDLPGRYTVENWTLPEAGTYYWRAHAIVEGAHVWGAEWMLIVREDLTLSAPDAPTTATAGEPVSFTVTIEAAAGVTGSTDHAGAHFGTTATTDKDAGLLTPSDYEGASPHTLADIPGSYTITQWTLDEPGTYHYRPHVIFEGVHYWGDEVTIVVS